MSVPLLKLEGINKKINNFELINITLDLYPGEVHVLMGENGSGKSLLMHLASGDTEADSGQIYFKSEKVSDKYTLLQLSSSTLYLKHDSSIFKMLSIPENIFFGKIPYKNRLLKTIDYEKLYSMSRELVEEFKLPFDINDNISELGYAQKQILKICRAYISNCDIMIFDDLFSGLMESEKEIIFRIIAKLTKKGIGIFCITHSLHDVLQVADKVTILKNGTQIKTMPVNSSSEQDIINLLSTGYGIKRYPKLKVPIGKPVLSVKNLNSLGILNNISLELRKGEILGVTGLAGSGRTLLAHCLFGFAPYSVDSYLINGNPVNISSPAEAIKSGIAMIPEDRLSSSIFNYLDIIENIAFPSMKRFSSFLSINSMYLQQSVYDYISKFNIPYQSSSTNILDYSSGHQQKAIIAKWIMSREKIFIFDEPTRNIDIASKIDIYNSICNLVQKGVSIIIISSDIDEIMGICDRVAVLAKNRLICNKNIKDITKTDIIKLSVGSFYEDYTPEN